MYVWGLWSLKRLGMSVPESHSSSKIGLVWAFSSAGFYDEGSMQENALGLNVVCW